ncbi:MAG: PP2C family protein-serine/threonine phosphatase [Bacteroidota bacterium]
MTDFKILIVDDEPFNVDYLEQELDDLGYKTVSACNGQEALEKVQAESPDLLLLDIMMPVMDGFEVLSRLKANPTTRDLPVIVISANTDLKSVVRGIQMGAEDYLPKPFEDTMLRARIASSLEKKRLRDIEQLYMKSMEHELEIGRKIQKRFLPASLPQVEGWEIAEYFKAAREVAGDFYDAFLLPDGKLVCVVGDVCDKGVGAALFMTLFRSLVRVTALTDLYSDRNELASLSPVERLQHIISFTNNYICETHWDANMFATLFVGIINPLDGTLTYANCGNERPILGGAGGEPTVLQATNPVVGIFPWAQYVIRQTCLEKCDMLLIFTDGIPDARNGANQEFGKAPVLKKMSDCNRTATDQLGQIVAELQSFIGTAEQFDDITMLAIRRNF